MNKVRMIVAALLISVFVSVPAFADGHTIAGIAAGSEDHTTLVSLLEAADLVGVLADEEADLVVFAPTNAAFDALSAATLNYLANDIDALTAVLTYHVAEAGTTAEDMSLMAEPVEADNGVVYIIDTVLVPPTELSEVDPLEYTEGEIITAGSSTVFPLSEAVAEAWSEAGGVAPSIDSIGSGAGFERFCVAGETDISNASRAIRDSEIESCAAIDRLPIEFRVGTDALSVVVSAENDFVTDVTAEELAQIFSTATNWSDVRAEWPEEPIARFIPGTDSGTFDFFVEEIFDEDEEPILSASNTQLSEDDNVLVQGVQGSPYAIGFFGFAFFTNNADSLTALAIDGVEPNGTSAEDGTYPLARPLFIYSDPQILADNPEVSAFVSYYLSNVNEVIGNVGYFPASDAALNLARFLYAQATGMGGM